MCGPTRLLIPALAGDAPHDPPCGVTVESLTVRVDEDRALETFADGEVEGPGDPWGEWHGDDLAALAEHRQGPVAAFQAERFDVRTDRLGDA